MTHDIDRLHHVCHVVDNMAEGLDLYRKLGFLLPPPTYYTLPVAEGEQPKPLGATNTHATLSRNFVEVATRVRGDGSDVPADAVLVPITVPAEHLDQALAALRGIAGVFDAWLARFQGVHILALHAADVDTVASRLDSAGIGHGGVTVAEQVVETADGPRPSRVKLVEIQGDDPELRGQVPEGRVVVAGDRSVESAHGGHHPNGAYDLVEAVLCAPEPDLAAVESRYESYLDRTASARGKARVFALDGAEIVLASPETVSELLPGERAPWSPALVAYTVAVQDQDTALRWVTDHGLPTARTARGDVFVPAAAALGTAVIFREV